MPAPYSLGLLGIYIWTGLLTGAAVVLYRSQWAQGKRIREQTDPRTIKGARLAKHLVGNGTLSGIFTFGVPLVLYGQFFSPAQTSWWVGATQIIALLVLYDFLYYFLHRDILHGPLQMVHAVHHQARFPQACDSLYLHPVETILGLLVWSGCIAIITAISPMHPTAFLIALWLYTTINVVVHWGLETRWPVFAYFDFMARKHDAHHVNMRAKNYASLSTLPDIVFGTTAPVTDH